MEIQVIEEPDLALLLSQNVQKVAKLNRIEIPVTLDHDKPIQNYAHRLILCAACPKNVSCTYTQDCFE
jgi:hypothetical protein